MVQSIPFAILMQTFLVSWLPQQEKQEIRVFILRRKNTGNLPKNIKICSAQENLSPTRGKVLKIKECTWGVIGCSTTFWFL